MNVLLVLVGAADLAAERIAGTRAMSEIRQLTALEAARWVARRMRPPEPKTA